MDAGNGYVGVAMVCRPQMPGFKREMRALQTPVEKNA